MTGLPSNGNRNVQLAGNNRLHVHPQALEGVLRHPSAPGPAEVASARPATAPSKGKGRQGRPMRRARNSTIGTPLVRPRLPRQTHPTFTAPQRTAILPQSVAGTERDLRMLKRRRSCHHIQTNGQFGQALPPPKPEPSANDQCLSFHSLTLGCAMTLSMMPFSLGYGSRRLVGMPSNTPDLIHVPKV